MKTYEKATFRGSRFRWSICALLFFATVINYVDRAVLGTLKPLLDADLGWNQIDYGWVVTSFQVAYAAGYLFSGRLVDRVGVKVGLLAAVAVWSAAAMGHSVVTSVSGFIVMRAVLGLAQGGAFPAAIKAIAEWFPRRERALATGLFNTGSNAGAILCPLLVHWIAPHWGWSGAFLLTGAVGLVWLVFWMGLYGAPESHRRVSPEELAFIRQEPPEQQVKLPWLMLLGWRQTWAFMVGMSASAPIWWFYIFWTPDFLSRRFHLQLTATSLPLVVIFLVSSLGGVGGGWLSSSLLKRGYGVNVARKTALLVCAVCVLPVFATPLVTDLWTAVALVALAAAAHCGFAANLFTLVSDTAPKQAVASIVGLGGMAGSLSGVAFSQLVSRVLEATNSNYQIPFAWAAGIYLAALGIMHLLAPRLEPVRLPAAASRVSA